MASRVFYFVLWSVVTAQVKSSYEKGNVLAKFERKIKVVPAQFFLEFTHFRIFINNQEFHIGHLGKILETFRTDGLAESGMMSATS